MASNEDHSQEHIAKRYKHIKGAIDSAIESKKKGSYTVYHSLIIVDYLHAC